MIESIGVGLLLIGAAASEVAPSLDFSETPVEAPVPDTVDAATREQLWALMREVGEGRAHSAAPALWTLRAASESSDWQAEVDYALGKALTALGLDHAAFLAWSRVVASGAEAPFYGQAVGRLFKLRRGLPDPQRTRALFSAYEPADFPPGYRDELVVLQSQWRYEQALAAWEVMSAKTRGVLEEADARERALAAAEAVKHLGEIRVGSPFAAKAAYLAGIWHVFGGEDDAALRQFRAALTRLEDPENPVHAPELHAQTLLSLARLHFEHRQFRASLHHYRRLPRGTEHWFDAMLEGSWAHYHRGELGKAMGMFVTLAAPFLADRYFPEAEVLRAVVAYDACRFDEATDVVDRLLSRYRPLLKVLSEDDTWTWRRLQAIDLEAAPTAISVVGLAMRDPGVERAHEAVTEVMREISHLDGHAWTGEASMFRTTLRDVLVAATSAAVVRRDTEVTRALTERRGEVRRLIAEALRVRIELVRVQREGASPMRAGSSRFTAPPQAFSAWRFQGEYWGDEVGRYDTKLTTCLGEATP